MEENTLSELLAKAETQEEYRSLAEIVLNDKKKEYVAIRNRIGFKTSTDHSKIANFEKEVGEMIVLLQAFKLMYSTFDAHPIDGLDLMFLIILKSVDKKNNIEKFHKAIQIYKERGMGEATLFLQ